MFLRIASHAIREGRFGDGHLRAVDKDAFVEVVDLFLQFDGMAVAPLFGHEHRLVLGLVAAQHQQVGDAQELQVEQHVFDVFGRESAAQHVGHHGDVVFVLDGGSDGYRTGTLADVDFLVATVGHRLVNIFAVMRRDVDVFRVELAQLVDDVIHFLDAVPFQRWENFKRKRGAFAILNQVNYFHIRMLFG